MSVEPESRPVPVLGIRINSTREVAIWMAVLFVICVLLLAKEIYRVVHGHFFGPTHLTMNYWSIFYKVVEAITAIYFIMFAFSFPKKSVKIAFALMGADFSVFVSLSFFSVSAAVGQIVAIIGSAVRQIALIIFCMAIAQWFRSVFLRGSPSALRGGDN